MNHVLLCVSWTMFVVPTGSYFSSEKGKLMLLNCKDHAVPPFRWEADDAFRAGLRPPSYVTITEVLIVVRIYTNIDMDLILFIFK